MKECITLCRDYDVSCPNKDCRMWIDYEDDLNCTFEAVRKNGDMTLREVAKRLDLSFVRVKQIQDSLLK